MGVAYLSSVSNINIRLFIKNNFCSLPKMAGNDENKQEILHFILMSKLYRLKIENKNKNKQKTLFHWISELS